MKVHREILLAVVFFIIGSVCSDTMIRRSVQVPVDQWQTVKSETVTDVTTIHKLLFVTQHDAAQVAKLKEIGDEVSDPDSVHYANFMSYDEVYQSVLPKTTENGHILEQWANTNGLKVTTTTKNKQYITVEASVDTVERVFKTKLQPYKHIETGKIVLRSTSFVLPSDIHNRMALIGGLSHFPSIRETKKLINDVTQVSANAPIIYRLTCGFDQYLFYIQLVCYDGETASTSFCENQFDGFQIYISGQSRVYNISVAQANCQVCSNASKLIALFCDTFSLKEGDVLCRFYLKESDSVSLYEPHTLAVRTRFLTEFSENATYGSAVEKILDVTPPVLRSLYNVYQRANAKRDKRSRQAIAGFQEYLDLSSFNDFAKIFGKQFTLLFGKIYGSDFNHTKNDELETSLDIQYMASMGFRIPTDYISSPKQHDGFLHEFFIQLALLEEDKRNVVPLVYSISYIDNEEYAGTSYVESCELQFLIMSVTGKTVFVSSGDAGSTGYNGKCRNVFVPGYPASSAYVTSVGATQFVQASGDCSRQINGYCLEEVTAVKSLLTGCRITSGGGFSNFIQSPKYQREAVQTYLNNTKNQLPPDTYFNRSNRAYPDISLVGHQYQLKVFGDVDLFLDGTSASSPATAGLISLIVDRRLRLGLKPFGLLNPLLYKLSARNSAVFYDVTKGNTSCNTSPICCQYGFVASKGWDPVTGFGSINHRKLMKQLTKK